MSTRSKTREKLGHVLQCDIEKDMTCTLTVRKDNKWYYLSVAPDEIEDQHIRGQYERRADAARQEQKAYQDFCNGSQDSGYGSDAEAEDDFQEWLQEKLAPKFEQNNSKPKNLKEWYAADVACFSLAEDVKERPDLDGKAFLKSIMPGMTLPKYIREREEITWYNAEDIEVVKEEHNIHMAIHPTVVRVKGKECFLKLAARGQEPAVKREIKFLCDFEKKGLYEKGIRAPRLEGVVKYDESVLGFLLSMIPSPNVPLTRLMTSEISQTKRDGWAREVKKQVEILHKAKMLWGDAKADNFLVDCEDKLWIIDFGGSFTVGWVDEDKYGTRRGEDEAVEKIVNGVKDPDHCTEGLVDETEDKTPSQSAEAKENKKRKRDESDDVAQEVEKRKKT